MEDITNKDIETTEEEEVVEENTVTMTKEELDKLFQPEGDTRVSTATQKIISDYEAKAKEQEEEAKRLAQLSAEERANEIQRQKDEEVAKLKAELRRRDLEGDTISRLNEEGIDISFKSFLMGNDEETTNTNIKTFKEVFNNEVQKRVEERLKGKTPKAGGSIETTINPFKRDTFNLTEQGKLFRENPELAQKLKREAKGE